MYRLPGERVTLDLSGPSVEVEPIHSWMVLVEVQLLVDRAKEADAGAAEYVALTNLFERFVSEAQPTWAISDHLGSIPATAAGTRRLPLPMQMAIIEQWFDTFNRKPEREELPEGLHVVESDAPSAVDAVIPPGPLQREIKKRLRSVKAAA